MEGRDGDAILLDVDAVSERVRGADLADGVGRRGSHGAGVAGVAARCAVAPGVLLEVSGDLGGSSDGGLAQLSGRGICGGGGKRTRSGGSKRIRTGGGERSF